MDKFATAGASLASFALRRPVTIGMVFFSMLVFGVIASKLLPLEKFPGLDIPFMVVQIPYTDATPAEVEKNITKPVEEALATMSGIKRLWSRSNENQAEIFMEFSWDENIRSKSVEAREKVDAIRHLLPSDVERILIRRENLQDMPIFQMRVSSERDLSNAYDLLDRNLKRPIERVQGVSRVALYGVLKKQISIRLDPIKTAALRLDPVLVVNTLQNANFAMTAGQFTDLDMQITVNPMGEYTSVSDIENLMIQQGIRLKDIASVTYETPRRTEGRHLDRTFAIGLDVYRESGANLVEVSDQVLKVVEEAKSDPEFNGINLFYFNNEAQSVTSSLSDLLDAGLIGAMLSILVLYGFLRSVTPTLIVVLSVPFSICITLGVMYFLDYSLNILSMMGLMLAVGMLVDNAVVVTESIYQEKEHNTDAIQATKNGVGKVSLAIIAGTATTAIVFLPNIVGTKDNITVFLEHVAIAICISLFASLLLAQTLIPLLTSRIKVKAKPAKHSEPGRFKRLYAKTLQWTISHQRKAFAIAIAILVSTAIPFSFVKSDDEGNNDRDRIWLNYNIQGSYTLEEVEQVVNKMEAFLYANQEAFHIKQVYSYFTAGHAVSGLTLNPDFPLTVAELKERIKQVMPTFVRAKPSFQWNDSQGGIKMTLLGQSSDTLLQLADNIVPVLSSVQGLTDVRADTNGQQYELQIKIDRQKAFRFGLNSEEVANMISTALRGSNLRTFRHEETGEMDIRLMFDERLQHSVEQLRKMSISQADGQNATLNMIADISVRPRLANIDRHYRQTALSIGANLEEGFTTEEARDAITNIMQNMRLPSGYKWTLDGSFRRQAEEQGIMLVNMMLAVCMIYIVMAALFESLLLPTAVITSLVFSITGVFWAFLVTQTPMSVMGMIGILILMGIVVNNGIVLVDRINQLVNQGMAVPEAIMQGSLSRVRPILMTVATTVLGLLPLALGNTQIGGDGPPYAPMAIAIIGGLLFSTLTSLFLVPLSYLLLLKLRRKTRALLGHSKALVGKVVKV